MTEEIFYTAVAGAAENYQKLAALARRFGSWQEAYEGLPREERGDIAAAETEIEKSGARIIMASDPEYPALLRQIPDPPFAIFVLGTLPKSEHAIAVVGTRRATTEGIRAAQEMGGGLARAGVVVVSGLALGIDAAAHAGCLAEKGKTVAVLAGGVGRIYPRENERLAREIIETGGAVMSEYPPMAESFPSRFLERNRITSGLAQAVVIVEAPQRSGALSTAQHAAEQNRDVFVVPGPVRNAQYAGSFALIRDGARLVRDVKDVLEDMGITREEQEALRRLQSEFAEERFNPEQTKIVKALRECGEAADVDKIAELTKLDPQTVASEMAELVLEEAVEENGGKYAAA